VFFGSVDGDLIGGVPCLTIMGLGLNVVGSVGTTTGVTKDERSKRANSSISSCGDITMRLLAALGKVWLLGSGGVVVGAREDAL